MNCPLDVPAAPGEEFSHVIPPARIIDRTVALKRAAAGKRVIHIGFVDEGRMKDRLQRGAWLHSQLAEVANELVGLDRDEPGVEAAREMGFEAHVVDCQEGTALAELHLPPGDVVIAGELIEHLDRPGLFLEAIKPLLLPEATLAITTPNATRLINILGSLANREFVNDDHVCWFSWHTLSVLLERHGWQIEHLAYYVSPPRAVDRRWAARAQAQVRAANILRQTTALIARARPAVADGLIVIARLKADALNGS